MNNIKAKEDNDNLIIIEPQYQGTTLSNLGVISVFSRNTNTSNSKFNSLLPPGTSRFNYCFHNTIMIKLINKDSENIKTNDNDNSNIQEEKAKTKLKKKIFKRHKTFALKESKVSKKNNDKEKNKKNDINSNKEKIKPNNTMIQTETMNNSHNNSHKENKDNKINVIYGRDNNKKMKNKFSFIHNCMTLENELKLLNLKTRSSFNRGNKTKNYLKSVKSISFFNKKEEQQYKNKLKPTENNEKQENEPKKCKLREKLSKKECLVDMKLLKNEVKNTSISPKHKSFQFNIGMKIRHSTLKNLNKNEQMEEKDDRRKSKFKKLKSDQKDYINIKTSIMNPDNNDSKNKNNNIKKGKRKESWIKQLFTKDSEKEKNMKILSTKNNNKYISSKKFKVTRQRFKRGITVAIKDNNNIIEEQKKKNLKKEQKSKFMAKNNSKEKINKKIDFDSALEKNAQKFQFNFFSKDKFTNTEFIHSDYLKYTLNCFSLILDIDKEKQVRLKNKVNFHFPKSKKKGIKKRIALFDLDETLVHCTGDIKLPNAKYQEVVDINLPGKQTVQVGINIRPYWKETLNLIKDYYHIVAYTASHQTYADSVLDFMDPDKKYFKHRLYRNNCSLVDVEGVKFYVKDLDIFNEHYDLKDIVIIDNSVLSFAFHLYNGIPIVPFYDEDKEGSLYVVGLYLVHIFNEPDLREANKIKINLDSFMEEAKKKIDEEEEPSENEKVKNLDEVTKDPKLTAKRDDKIKQKLRKKASTPYPMIESELWKKVLNNAQRKLMSQSRLMNMYYKLSDSSVKKVNSTSNESEHNSPYDETVKEFQIKDKIKGDNLNNSIIEEKDSDNKSESTYKIGQISEKFYQKSFYKDNQRNYRRLNTMNENILLTGNNSNLSMQSKLKFIRSNFDDNFKIE